MHPETGERGFEFSFDSDSSVEKNPYEHEIFEKLHPETIEDEEGISRTVFTFQREGVPVRVIFHGHDDLPLIPNETNLFSFGTETRNRSQEDIKKFHDRIQEKGGRRLNPEILDNRNLADGKALFLVEQQPRALLDMAIALGAETQEIREMRKSALEGEGTEALEQMIDRTIAADAMDDDGRVKSQPDKSGEALSLLALLGDYEAHALLTQRLSALEALTENVQTARVDQLRAHVEQHGKDVEPLKLNELVAVHVTRFEPKFNKTTKEWRIPSTYRATKGEYPRITQHFTLNHPVRSAGLYGSWEDSPTVILSPLESMMEKNGKPDNLNTIDTFWVTSPGRDIRVDAERGILIRPDDTLLPGEFMRQRGREVLYKSGEMTIEDIRVVHEKMSEWERKRFGNEVYQHFMGILVPDEHGKSGRDSLLSQEDFNNIARVLGATEEDIEFGMAKYRATRELAFPQELLRMPTQEYVNMIFEKSGVVVDETWKKGIVTRIQAAFQKLAKYQVIDAMIQKMGYEVHFGGMWAWDGDSWEATAQTNKLGAEIGIMVGPHCNHYSMDAEENIALYQSRLQKGELLSKDTTGNRSHFFREYFEKASPAFRRMMYEVGMI